MAYYDNSGRETYNAYDPHTQQPRQPLNHRVSALSVYDDPYEPSRPPLQTRESMVSLDSFVGSQSPHESDGNEGHTYNPNNTWSGSFGYSGAGGGGYAPVSASGGTPPERRPSRGGRVPSYQSSLGGVNEGDEEEYDLSLLQKAAPMARTPQYEPIAEEDFAFDITAALGPTTAQDEAFLKNLQEQEAKGNLTGGLGVGLQPETRVRDADLLASPTSPIHNLGRSFSRRNPSKRLGRAETIRHMGQDEANRRGEVIEVILEEPGTDLSNMEGPSTVAVDEVRRSTFPVKKEQKTAIFYPQPNWKPFSMRWPYLISLIILSVALAVLQELLFQRYKNNPILKFKSPNDVEPGLYFVIKFLPTVCAVAYGVFWQFTDFEVRRLEAYHQLARQQGALASKSINVDYVTSFSFFRPFRALKLGHYAVALSSLGSILAVSLVPTCAAASIVLTPSRKERMDHPDQLKEVYFAPVWSRILTVTLAVCAVIGCWLFYILQSRRSGLLADVRGIAGLASMAVVSHILMDFKDMDTAKHKDIHDKLKLRRYMLRNSSLAPYEGTEALLQNRERDENTHLSENPHPLMLRPVGCIPFIIGIFVFAGFIPTFLFTPADVVTDKAAWVVTTLAVVLKLCWGAMETAVRMMEPYYILSRRHAPSKTLMLDYTALPFGYMPIRALFNGHFLVFFVGFGSVMAEFLTIMVTSLATVEGQDFIVGYDGDASWKDKAELVNAGQETVVSFYVSLGLTLFILMYMMIVAIIVFFRRRHPFLPRQPNTIASVLAFIHQSKMLYNFVGTAKLSTTEMAKKLNDGVTYGLGWFQGRDGQTHCGVDQEELTSSYKHGLNYLDGTKPWDTQWDVL